jgi:hypothetical protein
MLDYMKRQLTKFHGQNNKNFGFGTILCSLFFFESTHSQSTRDSAGACGLSPNSVYMGNIVVTLGGRKDHRGLR